MPIKLLEEQVISRIAAGEVIERPASVVKELVENSLDAGATQISVETAGGGTGLIRVSDNGCGIVPDELELAFRRHATSKISGLDDLVSISSLGFRGEALPSIANVSKVEVVTATAGNTGGSFISLDAGVKTGQGSRARAQGTTITVKDLLRNVPARLKFLKTAATESSHISNVVSQYALAYPEVRFNLTTDGRAALRTPGSGRLIDAIAEVYGQEIARSMLEMNGEQAVWGDGETKRVSVGGMAGAPGTSRANRNYLSFFVNRRWINSRLLTWAVEEAYHGLLMQGRHPVAVILIDLPGETVDVNIHPTKTEVKFRDERLVFSAVQKAVRSCLLDQAPVPGIEEVTAVYGAPPHPAAGRPFWSFPSPAPAAPAGKGEAVPADEQPTPAMSLPALRLLGQIAGTYIAAEGPDGLYLIDQHAAHERIVFEKMQEQRRLQKLEVQGLLEPVAFEVSPLQDDILRERYAELSEFGFTLEPFGERSYLVRAVPLLLHKRDWAAALRELLDALAADRNADWREELAITFACHGAIRAGQTLSDEEMREMLRQLEPLATPNTCPHGRPTIIRLGTGQLEREFRRK